MRGNNQVLESPHRRFSRFKKKTENAVIWFPGFTRALVSTSNCRLQAKSVWELVASFAKIEAVAGDRLMADLCAASQAEICSQDGNGTMTSLFLINDTLPGGICS